MISPKPLTEYRNILDFGCGCGRLSRMFKGHPNKIFGCDIDKRHVEWVSKNIDFINAAVSSIHPPLPYANDQFDCVISISVFSHLNETSQDEFLADLCRISQPGAYLFISVHGENAMQRAINEKSIREMIAVEEAPFQEAQQRLKRGQHAFILQKGHLTNTAEDRGPFSFFRKRRKRLIEGAFEYGISFIPLNYIRQHWSRWFEIVDFRPGAIHNFQDLLILSPKTHSRPCAGIS
jgi:SAM-dependent methyltransferase